MARPRFGLARATARGLVAKYELTPPIDINWLATELGYEVRRESFEDSLSGMLVTKHNIIAVNRRHPMTRQRFTIAHEIGHALLHRSDQALFVDEAAVHLRTKSRPHLPDPREVEANRFAAELLMPEKPLRDFVPATVEIYEELTLIYIAGKFQVSVPAVTARLSELGLTLSGRSHE
jgi:Zn-dependent peptidase ImmA (M78 family)